MHVIVWVALFLLLRPGLIDHPGKAVSHGHMFAHGVGGAEKDTRKAAALFEKSCYRGVPLGCFELAKLYLAGDGVPNDVDEARRLLRKACDGGEWGACTELGVLMFGAGDRAGGVALYERACEESEPNACANLGLVYLKETTGTGDAKKAARYLKRACELEHEGACRLAAEQTTPQRTEVLCRRGDADACTRLALDKQRDGAPASDVVPLLETACKGQSWSGCNVLGGLYARGIGVPQDLKRASELAELACQGGQGDACGNLAGMYLEGRGVDRNLSKAKALFQRACGCWCAARVHVSATTGRLVWERTVSR